MAQSKKFFCFFLFTKRRLPRVNRPGGMAVFKVGGRLYGGREMAYTAKKRNPTFQGGPNRPPFLLEFCRLPETPPLNRPSHSGLEGRIAEMIAPRLEAMGYELVRVQVIGKESPTVQIMADRADDAAFTLDDCTEVSHLLSAVLDVEDPIASAWTLEVSSAGIDRPLTRVKDWLRYAGYEAKAELNFPGPGGRKRFTGVIIAADAEYAQLKIETGETVALKLGDIRKAKLILTDALIAFSTQPLITN
jgi:ribosome maturation factor RimP